MFAIEKCVLKHHLWVFLSINYHSRQLHLLTRCCCQVFLFRKWINGIIIKKFRLSKLRTMIILTKSNTKTLKKEYTRWLKGWKSFRHEWFITSRSWMGNTKTTSHHLLNKGNTFNEKNSRRSTGVPMLKSAWLIRLNLLNKRPFSPISVRPQKL